MKSYVYYEKFKSFVVKRTSKVSHNKDTTIISPWDYYFYLKMGKKIRRCCIWRRAGPPTRVPSARILMKGLPWPNRTSIQGIWVYWFRRIRMKSSSSWKIVESPAERTNKKLFLEVAVSLNERSPWFIWFFLSLLHFLARSDVL